MTGLLLSRNRSDRSYRSDCPGGQPRTFKPKHLEVGTWKTNQPKVQGKLANQKPTFGQLLNKYSKATRNDRPKRDRGHLHVEAHLLLLGDSQASTGVMWLPCSLFSRHSRCTLQCHGFRRHRILSFPHGRTEDFGCNVIGCRVHHTSRGREALEGLYLIG